MNEAAMRSVRQANLIADIVVILRRIVERLKEEEERERRAADAWNRRLRS